MDTVSRNDDRTTARQRILHVLAATPAHAPALVTLGEIWLREDKPARALAPLRRAVRIDPSFANRMLLSHTLQRCGARDEAFGYFQQTLTIVPASGSAWFVMGGQAEAFGLHADAAEYYAKSLEYDPDSARVWHRLGYSLLETDCVEAAISAFQNAVRLEPSNADAWIDLSSALSRLGRFDEAGVVAEMARYLNPAAVAAWHNWGHALLNLNRSQEALTVFDEAMRLAPELPIMRFARATALLKSGDFENGWREYEWRWRDCQSPRRDIDAPLWQGEALQGRRILLHAEQGFGDSLQFVRFAPQLAARGAYVVLHVPQTLARLLRDVEGVAEAVSYVPPEMHFDFHCPLASLPYRLSLTLETIPSRPYLSVSEKEQQRQGGALRRHVMGDAVKPPLIVGLVWSGDPRKSDAKAHRVDRRRSCDLADLSPFFAVPGVRFVSFQLGEARRQIAESGLPVIDVMEGVEDFADTAARLSGIDLLISVDTSIVHLAGGMGLPVWMLSRFDACWRWLENRDDTPWYPEMRIFHQPILGDWAGAIGNASSLLQRLSNIYWREAA
ncbi:tetratricopeptide repeat protein [Kozakia baliensis]|uniref:tetratricopeptide repeat-containing glycosyltransferase family protein n=1 Tax=Kozakia baliensis TaxID=153496 RepID=UPI00068F7F88|nr:tetratricopeptide repeat-containing glycosyltransferase family protein [Kozakia baliensis]